MPHKKPDHLNPANQPADPLMVASSLNSLMTDRNPLQVLVGEMLHMVKVITNLGKNRKLAQTRIEQLQAQMEKVERNMATVNPKTSGNRLDKLR